jgi:hypothetical protein
MRYVVWKRNPGRLPSPYRQTSARTCPGAKRIATRLFHDEPLGTVLYVGLAGSTPLWDHYVVEVASRNHPGDRWQDCRPRCNCKK